MDTEAEGMDTEAEAPEVERTDHMSPEVVCRRSIILREAAKPRRWSDGVSERYHLGEGLETRRTARDP